MGIPFMPWFSVLGRTSHNPYPRHIPLSGLLKIYIYIYIYIHTFCNHLTHVAFSAWFGGLGGSENHSPHLFFSGAVNTHPSIFQATNLLFE